MKIIVTGATGFIGTALCGRLASQGHEVTRISSRICDLRDQSSLERFSGDKFDQIYHLAAWTQAGDFCLRHPGEQWIINQRINTNVLDWWLKAQPQAKLVAMGTSCAYAPDRDLAEENYLDGVPIDSLFTYAMTKRMLYTGLLALHKQYGLQYLYLVPSTVYGPGYHTDGRQMHFIFDLIRKILHAKTSGEQVVLWGDGHQRRELVYIEDFISATVRLNTLYSNDIVNIGAGLEHSIRDFAEIICGICAYNARSIRYDETRYVGARSKVLSVSKLKGMLPDLTMVPLQEGLEKTIRWYKEEFL